MIVEHEDNGESQRPDGAESNGKLVSLKQKHLILTDRDVSLLVSLHDHVALSFAQIHRRHFMGRSLPTAMNRLTRIESHGLIVRIRVPRFHVCGSKRAAGVVFQLSSKGRLVLTKHRPAMSIFEKCPTLNPHQLEHDLLLADISDFFKRQNPGRSWTNGRYLNGRDGVNKIPDAVLYDRSGDKLIAVELELNGKSSRRYVEIIANLKGSRRIEKVIFVTSSTVIGRKIMSAIEGFQVAEGHVLRSEFFEFVRLSECLKANDVAK